MKKKYVDIYFNLKLGKFAAAQPTTTKTSEERNRNKNKIILSQCSTIIFQSN